MNEQMNKIKTFSIAEVEALVKTDSCNWDGNRLEKKKNNVVVEGYQVYTRSLRYKTFIEKGYKCVCCGRVGTHYILEQCIGQNIHRAHFNLYSDDNVLMTKDHIYPKSQGGKDKIENLQTMCAICNKAKGSEIPDKYDEDMIKDNCVWGGDKRYKSIETAARAMTNGNKKIALIAKIKIENAIKTGESYYGKTWRYGKKI